MNVKKYISEVKYWGGWFWMAIAGAAAFCVALFWHGRTRYWGAADSDLTNQFYPWHDFIHRWFARGIWPYWDPHVFSGYPTVETQQMLALNPVHLISLLFGAHWGLPMQMALHGIICMAGMAWGLRRLGRCSPLAAALGAMVFVWGTLFTIRVVAGHFTVVAGLVWWPLALLSVLRLMRWVPAGEQYAGWGGFWNSLRSGQAVIRTSKRVRRLIVICVIAHAMVCLAGGPQYIVYLFYMEMTVWLVVSRRWAWPGSLTLLAAVWVLALLISAPQWLPALWYLPLSSRASGGGGLTGLSWGPFLNLLLEGVMPYPFGDDVKNGHLHFKNVWETGTYPGAVAVWLSLALGLRWMIWGANKWLRLKPLATRMTPLGLSGVGIVVMGFYMAAGGWLPGFGGFRDPTKARAVLAFGVSLMAASQADGLMRRGARLTRTCGVIALVVMAGLFGWAGRFADVGRFRELVVSFGAPFDSAGLSDYEEFLSNAQPAAFRYTGSWQHAVGAGIILPLTALAFLAIFRKRHWAWGMAGVIILMGAATDLVSTNGNKWLARHEWSAVGLPSAMVQFFEPKLSESKNDFPWRTIIHPGIINRTHHLEGLYEYRGYDPLMPSRGVSRLLVKGLKDLPAEEQTGLRPEILAKSGVRYNAETWLSKGTLDDLATQTIQYSDSSLFELTRKVKVGSLGEEMFGPALDGTHYVLPASRAGKVLDEEDLIDDLPEVRDIVKTMPAEFKASETSRPLVTGRPDEFGISVSLQSPALIVYKGTWLPGWRVSVDGRDQGQALYTNNWMCGALVDAGNHDVVFRYRPVAWKTSWLLCGTGLIVTIGFLLRNDNRRNTRNRT